MLDGLLRGSGCLLLDLRRPLTSLLEDLFRPLTSLLLDRRPETSLLLDLRRPSRLLARRLLASALLDLLLVLVGSWLGDRLDEGALPSEDLPRARRRGS